MRRASVRPQGRACSWWPCASAPWRSRSSARARRAPLRPRCALPRLGVRARALECVAGEAACSLCLLLTPELAPYLLRGRGRTPARPARLDPVADPFHEGQPQGARGAWVSECGVPNERRAACGACHASAHHPSRLRVADTHRPAQAAPIAGTGEPAGASPPPEKRARLQSDDGDGGLPGPGAPGTAPTLPPSGPLAPAHQGGEAADKPAAMDWAAAEPTAGAASDRAPPGSAPAPTASGPGAPEGAGPTGEGAAPDGAPAGAAAAPAPVTEVGRDEEMPRGGVDEATIAAAAQSALQGHERAAQPAPGAPQEAAATHREAEGGPGAPVEAPHDSRPPNGSAGAEAAAAEPQEVGGADADAEADLPDDDGDDGTAADEQGDAGSAPDGGPNPDPAEGGSKGGGGGGAGEAATPAGPPRKAERRKIEWAPAAADAAPAPTPAAAAPASAPAPAQPATSGGGAAPGAAQRFAPVLPAVRALQAALPPQGADAPAAPGASTPGRGPGGATPGRGPGGVTPGRGPGAGRGLAARRGRGPAGHSQLPPAWGTTLSAQLTAGGTSVDKRTLWTRRLRPS